MGLWLVQECRRTWARSGREYSYEDLIPQAEAAPAFRSLVDPDHPSFLPPGDMPARIAAYCRDTGQPVPDGEGAFVRCALESLALKYRWVVERLEEVTGTPIRAIHIVGGGARNALLNQFTADATGRPVLRRPGRGDGDRQPADAGQGPGPDRLAGRTPRGRRPLVPRHHL